jgi:hypothetical protein
MRKYEDLSTGNEQGKRRLKVLRGGYVKVPSALGLGYATNMFGKMSEMTGSCLTEFHAWIGLGTKLRECMSAVAVTPKI